jgi:hypothetical protein
VHMPWSRFVDQFCVNRAALRCGMNVVHMFICVYTCVREREMYVCICARERNVYSLTRTFTCSYTHVQKPPNNSTCTHHTLTPRTYTFNTRLHTHTCTHAPTHLHNHTHVHCTYLGRANRRSQVFVLKDSQWR